jgi:2-dehydro-3-deoxyphosphogluconate aldolase / (4S)-4-hydroxy-2-oxoglutarate aldolase
MPPDMPADLPADLLAALRRERLLAVVRGRDRSATVAAALTLVECGVQVVEISLSGVDALAALRDVRARAGTAALVGCGTVLTAADADAAGAAGAQFTVTPGNGPGAERSVRSGLPCLVGALTPTEIAAAAALGAAVKLFPASLGGPGYLRAVRAPLPDVPLVPVGGVDAALAREYLAAGAVAVGVGTPLVGDAADAGGDLVALRRRADDFLSAVRR